MNDTNDLIIARMSHGQQTQNSTEVSACKAIFHLLSLLPAELTLSAPGLHAIMSMISFEEQ